MTKSIEDSWSRISAWLATVAPGVLARLQPAATTAELDSLSSLLKRELPPEFQQLYGFVNGSDPNSRGAGLFPSHDEYHEMAYEPLCVSQIISDWKIQEENLEDGEFDDLTPQSEVGIRDHWWDTGWIPFAWNGGGDYYCIDMNPAADGKSAQVISHCHESGEHKLLAGSLACYLETLAAELEAGKYEYDLRYGVRVPRSIVQERKPQLEDVRNPWTFESETLPAANDAFRNKDYARCVRLLIPYEDMLDKVSASKLAIARKRSGKLR